MKKKTETDTDMRKASIKETGEELSQEQWARFDAAVAEEKAKRDEAEPFERGAAAHEPGEAPSGSKKRPDPH